MPGFQYSSSPPSTPDRRPGGGTSNFFGGTDPSTTPAGPPPPSSAGSFTPAGPPPSSVLGSSLFTSNNAPFNFSKQSNFNSQGPQFQSSQYDTAGSLFGKPQKPKSGLRQEFGFSNKRTPVDLTQDDNIEGDDYDAGRDSRGYQLPEGYSDEAEDHMDEDRQDEYHEGDGLRSPTRFNSSGPLAKTHNRGFSTGTRKTDTFHQSPVRSIYNQSRRDDMLDFQKSLQAAKVQRPAEPIYGKIAKDLAARNGIAKLKEPADIIIETEEAMSVLYADAFGTEDDAEALERALATMPHQIVLLWTEHNREASNSLFHEYASVIGPGPKAEKFSTAQFLASLLLKLRHPTIQRSAHQSPTKTLRLYQEAPNPATLRHIPSMLLDWLIEQHDPSPNRINEIRQRNPSAAAHPLFWETLLNSVLRGKIYVAALALNNAGWEYASADGRSDKHYEPKVLKNIKKVVEEASRTMSACPALLAEDWNVRGSDWTLFRLRVTQALENLKMFAEGRNEPQSDDESPREQSTEQKSQSRIPWTIVQRLTTLYNLLLGDELAILESAQDWCEATIALTVWWNPEKEDRAFGRSHHTQKSTPEDYYERLTEAFYIATQDSEFEVNTLSIAETGLASIFEGDVSAVIALLQSCSLPVAATVVEIAAIGGWLPLEDPQRLITMGGLDQDDMDVLGLTGSEGGSDDLKDNVLIHYAAQLAQKETLEYTRKVDGKHAAREGWELSIEILGRLNSTAASEQEINGLIDDFSLESSEAVDKLWHLLNYLGMSKQAEKIAWKYADSLANYSKNYGGALWYYALSHQPKKVKDVLDLLTSYSLIHSTAWPPAAELDDYLATLIASPKAELVKLSKVDIEAAELLHKMLSGYATLRTFYSLRDAVVNSDKSLSHISSKVRTSQATSALLAVLASADDNIRGGLYDESREAVVSVDFLLALLGETLVLLSDPTIKLTTSQLYTILKTVEDLQGVQSIQASIYNNCETFLQTVIASTPGLKGSNPMNLLSKSTSNLSGSGESFSLVGSSMLASQLMKSMSSSSAITTKIDIKRGWDWRAGLVAGMKGADVLRILRLGLASELARTAILEAQMEL